MAEVATLTIVATAVTLNPDSRAGTCPAEAEAAAVAADPGGASECLGLGPLQASGSGATIKQTVAELWNQQDIIKLSID